MIIIVLGVAFIASIAKFWPYDLTPSLKNYNFDMMDGGGWESYRNSLTMSALTAVLGTAIIFTGAYLLEKTTRFAAPRSIVRFLTLLPLAVPGLVLGLGFIFFFNDKNNPLNFIYGTMAILVLCTIGHFYSVAHLTATTALKQIDPEFETVSSSLKVPIYKTFLFVTLAGVPAGGARDRDVSLRQCDDDGVGGRLPLFAQDDARLDRGAQHGRCRRRGAGGSHGDHDLPDIGGGADRLYDRHRIIPAPRPGLAAEIEKARGAIRSAPRPAFDLSEPARFVS